MYEPFSAPQALIARANHHIEKLDWAIGEFKRANKNAPYTDRDSATGYTAIKLELSADVPPYISCVIFDAVNNLRSALDYAIFDAVALICDIQDPQHTKFPFGKNASDCEENFKWRNFPAGLDPLRDYIINEIQPYKTGIGNPLWRLNNLRNQKIHRTLTPTEAGSSTGIVNGGFRMVTFLNEWDRKTKILTILRAKEIMPNSRFNFTLGVAFVGHSAAAGGEVLTTLKAFSRAVADAVNKIESHVYAQRVLRTPS